MPDSKLSENVAKIFEKSQKDQAALEAYQHTVNNIDDFFEYSNQSISDRKFIHEQLDKLTGKLAKIYNES